MKSIGLLLVAAGFLAGSYVGVRSPENEVDWTQLGVALVVAVVGVVLARTASRGAAKDAGRLTTNVDALSRSIESILAKVTDLDSRKTEMHPYELHIRIDELFPEDLNTFVQARESIGHVYGLQAYAEVMNEFAAGERYLNRVWSASVDCYIDDVHEYLGRAKEQFTHTRDKLRELARA